MKKDLEEITMENDNNSLAGKECARCKIFYTTESCPNCGVVANLRTLPNNNFLSKSKYSLIFEKLDSKDCHVYGGILLIAVGLWMQQPWISLTIAGVLILALGIVGALR